MRRWTTDELWSTLDEELRAACAAALVLSAPRARPTIELLTSRETEEVVSRLPWRSARDDPHGSWRAPATVYGFDGGAGLVCSRSRPGRGLRGRSRLLATLATRAGEEHGLVELDPADEAVYAALELGRRHGTHPGRARALEALLARTSRHEVLVRARDAGVEDVVARAIAHVGAGSSAGASTGVAARTSGVMARRTKALARRAGLRTTRCRFDGLELLVADGVYLPRGVSEPFAPLVAELLPRDETVVDVGTGCGALALAIANRRSDASVIGVDIDRRAVRCARRNARRSRSHGAGVPTFLTGSLLEPLAAEHPGTVGMVVAVMPCLAPDEFQGAADAPSAAYVGESADGLGLVRELARQAASLLRPDGWLVVQVSPAHWARLTPELRELGFEPEAAAEDDVAIFGRARRARPAIAVAGRASC